MNPNVLNQTEFTTIKKQISQLAISDYGKKELEQRQVSTDLATVEKRLTETEEALLILNSGQHVPFMGMKQIQLLNQKIEKGFILEAIELQEYSDFLHSFRLVKQLFEKNQYQAPTLFTYTQALTEFKEIVDEINRVVSGNQVKTDSSRTLKKVRGKIQKLESDIEKSFTKYLKNATTQKYLQERLIVKKDERYTLPVKSEFQSKIHGQIIEKSNRGTTVFIEPEGIRKQNEALQLAKAEEIAEVYQLLAYLTGLVAEQAQAIQACTEIIVELDVIFARGKYSRSIDGKRVLVNQEDELVFDGVKHPLLGSEAVGLDLALGCNARGLIITGPNAGGKTVVLKTVALTCLLTMFGVFVNHQGKTNVAIFKDLFLDIGDQQSMENALSTFSGHMQNISNIVRLAPKHSLVLLDEIGSGTEPKEGAALGIAIMEELYQQGAIVIATTHYGEIKDFALAHEDFQTAAMAFDSATLTPKFRLLMNQVGDSNAFWIARKMEIHEKILQRAQKYLVGEAYQTQKVTFKKRKNVQVLDTKPAFSKGDRLYLTEQDCYGLFYELVDSELAQVYVDNQLQEVALRRVKLVMPASELYPMGYDLESLFSDFQERKFTRDIDRGSKKAQKQLRKLAENRQERQK
ncbi:MAG: endonuclease MutS2 [Enterococcus sp.]